MDMRLILLLSLGLLALSCSESNRSLTDACPLAYLAEDESTICGYLEVPENRNDPDSRSIRLAYLVLKAKSKNPKADPVIFLQGGPGGATLVQAEYWRHSVFREDRDLIFVDQRGTGYSDAVCPGLGLKMLEILAMDLTPQEEGAALKEAAEACKSEIKELGQDQAGYNTIHNAQDIDDLRKALGYEQLNLLGVSYGSRLALAYMRDFPENVRSSLLSGLFPPQANLYADFISNFNRSLKGVFDLCEADDTCRAKYPDLRATFYEVLTDLKTNPSAFSWGGEPFVINPQDMLMLIHQQLYVSYDFVKIPAFIFALRDENEQALQEAIQPLAGRFDLINFAMNRSFNAFDEMTFTDRDALLNDLERNAELKPGPAFFMSDPEILSEWHQHRAPAYVNEPVKSSIPTFLANGELDPVTPPSNVRATMKYLSNAWYAEFPNEGHGVYGDCYFSMVLEFMDNPTQAPDMGCSKALPQLDWK